MHKPHLNLVSKQQKIFQKKGSFIDTDMFLAKFVQKKEQLKIAIFGAFIVCQGRPNHWLNWSITLL